MEGGLDGSRMLQIKTGITCERSGGDRRYIHPSNLVVSHDFPFLAQHCRLCAAYGQKQISLPNNARYLLLLSSVLKP